MKQGRIEKMAQEEITPEQLEKISQYTRRTLPSDKLFVFPIVLCDNEVDRDCERFTEQSLAKLAELFVGKTGVFDHVARAENQSARIFDTEVVTTADSTSLGSSYQYLKAWAYMVRCEKNETLILEIDAGIKKEVSVGCAVSKIYCSVCGNEQKENPCQHQKGKSYGGVLCHYLLEQPTDAYEWSFVAVPAQRNAGVTKRYGEFSLEENLLEKIFESKEEVLLTKQQVYALRSHLKQLDRLAEQGQQYTDQLCKEVIRYASIAQPALDSALLETVTRKMSLPELQSFHRSYQNMATEKISPMPQLARMEAEENPKADTHFKI